MENNFKKIIKIGEQINKSEKLKERAIGALNQNLISSYSNNAKSFVKNRRIKEMIVSS